MTSRGVPHFSTFLPVLSALLAPLPASAGIIDMHDVTLNLARGRSPGGASWSRTLIQGRGGLVHYPGAWRRGKDSIWIQSHVFPAGRAWRPPDQVRVHVALRGKVPKAYQLRASLRYGCDGKNWSAWRALPGNPRSRLQGARTWSTTLKASAAARADYHQQMRRWHQTRPRWSADEDALCRWLIKRDPGYFARNLPFVGYLQLRLEGVGRPRSQLRLSSLIARLAWGVGGLHTEPRSGKADYHSDWHCGRKRPRPAVAPRGSKRRPALKKADTIVAQMDAARQRAITLFFQAVQKRDVIKLNCVREKVFALKDCVDGARRIRDGLELATARGRKKTAAKRATSRLAPLLQKARALERDAGACMKADIKMQR